MADLFQFEGILLGGPASDSFADFYREHVRPQDGARLPSTELRVAYERWCANVGVTPASSRAVRQFMEANGHRQRKSSLIYYADAVLGDFEGVALPKRSMPMLDARPMREAVNVMAAELDDIIAELQGMRRRLGRLMPTRRDR